MMRQIGLWTMLTQPAFEVAEKAVDMMACWYLFDRALKKYWQEYWP